MTLYKWSQTASADATADSTINWAEGQSPSSVNDSARAMMAAIAKHRDDIAGAIVTSGTSTAYTVASYQQFDTLAHLSGQAVAFTPHATNGATVTINVDGLGAKPLRAAPNVELPAGTVVQGTPYVALYNNADGVFYLHGFYGNPYNIPLAAGMDYWAATTPNSSFAFPTGQAISRTTYSTLFALIGTTYGGGDGSTTFNLPDKRGRISAGFDTGNATARLNTGGVSAATLGSAGGSQYATLVTGNLPAYTPSGSVSGTATSSNSVMQNGGPVISIQGAGGGSLLGFGLNNTPSFSALSSSMSGTLSGTPQGGTSTPFSIVPPTIVCNYIIRII
ncbi:tail fiber protein [Bradyrhizobium diazoefficiens]|uniref:phage tail protein n=1 Tax=Bradyrhizobium diazoefficiens TaxID=1355477 RepID=UPI001909C7B7|nr:tail fiber protein [Bradyrhizobium diazoefficiens]QQO36486.1 tail fiber protein [Bradyrhizobium diazoefficiens]